MWLSATLTALLWIIQDYEEDASKVFANTDIKGGVAITYHNDLKNFGAIQVFTKYSVLNGILKKIKNADSSWIIHGNAVNVAESHIVTVF